MVGRAPKMGRCPGSEKRRDRGEGAGAEDGDTGEERVRGGAANWAEVQETQAARGRRLLTPLTAEGSR
jgi:hypothetical protein